MKKIFLTHFVTLYFILAIRLKNWGSEPNIWKIIFLYSLVDKILPETLLGESKKMANHDQELDASGLNCPLPILRAKKTLNGMESGQILQVTATDPGSVKDFDAFAKQTGNELLETSEEGGKYLFLLKKK